MYYLWLLNIDISLADVFWKPMLHRNIRALNWQKPWKIVSSLFKNGYDTLSWTCLTRSWLVFICKFVTLTLKNILLFNLSSVTNEWLKLYLCSRFILRKCNSFEFGNQIKSMHKRQPIDLASGQSLFVSWVSLFTSQALYSFSTYLLKDFLLLYYFYSEIL